MSHGEFLGGWIVRSIAEALALSSDDLERRLRARDRLDRPRPHAVNDRPEACPAGSLATSEAQRG